MTETQAASVQVRTQTLVKNAIIQVDATPFKQWYQQHYGVEPGQKKRGGAAAPEAEVISLHACFTSVPGRSLCLLTIALQGCSGVSVIDQSSSAPR